MAKLVTKLLNQDFSYQSFTHEQHLAEEIFESCIFSHCDMNFSFFRNKTFIECDFRHADIGGTEFENCELINCAFEYTNLTNASFIGCTIENSKEKILINEEEVSVGFYRSSSSNMTFSESNNQRTKLTNVVFKDIGLRECLISGTDIIGVSFSSISLEDSKLYDCTFNKLNLMSNNIKGLLISECQIEKLEITFEKLLNIIGVEFVLKCKEISIHLDSRLKSPSIQELNEGFISSLVSTKSNLLSTGAIFEYLNLSVLEHVINGNFIDVSFIEEILDEYVANSTGRPIPPHNFLSMMELLIHYDINSELISRKLRSLAALVAQFRMSEKQKALIFFKLEKLTQISIESHVAIEVTDRSSSFNLESRQALAEFTFQLLNLSDIKNSNALSQRTGSVIEQILVHSKDLIENFWQLTILLSLMGFKFKKEFKDGTIVEFSLIPSILGKKKDKNNQNLSLSNSEQEELKKLLKSNNIKPSHYTPKKLTDEERKILKNLKNLISQKEVHISIKKAAVKEVISNENIKALLIKR